ncbi:putative lipase/esterase [Virgisporangium aliadipatigenens]|uniref:Putative lipase/esterase n=1 Tax=Virgisporangium aliadipatigenens TaxID=741659 RepID=A0A8J3YVI8_9ACTN|nr:alpha/beta hydrolase [Virgisporangium aliadipatigenens]GIJ51452.1 putative lipase/esterase [Virgisporangium aliadipatigenens]
MDPDRLHPQARAALGGQHRDPLTVDNLDAVRRGMRDATAQEVGPGRPVRRVLDLDAAGVPVRLYDDGTADAAPVLLWAHGGGWVLGDLDTHDGLCRSLALETGWAVLAVDYRRAPEHPYPAAIEDLERVRGWLEASGRAHGLDPERVAVAGDSAGGQLATVVARRARDAGRPVAAQALVCPVVGPATDYPPLDAYGLHRDEMRFFWNAYAPAGVDRDHPDLDPLRADLSGMPPTVIITAELDVLCAEAEEYAARLAAAGVPVVCSRYTGLIHNFPRKLALFDAAPFAIAQIAAALRRWA